jgi:cyclophilin family peptidyl-prolyl cis-trans isomerase
MRDKIVTLIAVIVVLGLVWTLNVYNQRKKKPATPEVREITDMKTDAVAPGKKLIATVETNKGTFSFELFPEDAPATVQNFVKLAREGFYDGTIFHRVVPGFVIQGGDPTGTGTGGPGYTIKAEFNARKHVAGTVAMARSADPNSAGSQFYVCLASAPHLDRSYTVFGQVVDGMDVVQAIGGVATDASSRPVKEVVMTKMTVREEPAEAP